MARRCRLSALTVYRRRQSLVVMDASAAAAAAAVAGVVLATPLRHGRF